MYFGKSKRGKYAYCLLYNPDRGIEDGAVFSSGVIESELLEMIFFPTHMNLEDRITFYNGIPSRVKKSCFRSHHGGPFPLNKEEVHRIFGGRVNINSLNDSPNWLSSTTIPKPKKE